jgi:hypothetical protein
VAVSLAMTCAPGSIAGEECLHAASEVGARRPEEEVEVVAHDNEAEHQAAGAFDGPLEVGESDPKVLKGFPSGRMGDKASDGEGPTQAGGSGAIGVVPGEPTRADRVSTPGPQAEAPGPLRVLRDHGQLLLQPPGFPGGVATDLAAMAVASPSGRATPLARLPSPGGPLPAPTCARGPRAAEPRSEVMRCRAGCGRSASPDLWESGESDLPGRPGPRLPPRQNVINPGPASPSWRPEVAICDFQ